MPLSGGLDDPRCPDCGGPVGPAATYCLHCSADLTGRGPVDAAELPGEGGTAGGERAVMDVSTAAGTSAEHPLDPDGVVDNTLTVLVGIVGGLVVGLVGTVVLLFLTGSGWALLAGLVGWLGATAYLVRRRYVMDAVAKSAYGLALVLLAAPLGALTLEAGLLERGTVFLALLFAVGIPAAVVAGVGWVAARFVPGDAGTEG